MTSAFVRRIDRCRRELPISSRDGVEACEASVCADDEHGGNDEEHSADRKRLVCGDGAGSQGGPNRFGQQNPDQVACVDEDPPEAVRLGRGCQAPRREALEVHLGNKAEGEAHGERCAERGRRSRVRPQDASRAEAHDEALRPR